MAGACAFAALFLACVALAVASAAPRVPVTFFVMAKCPDALVCEETLGPYVTALAPIVDFRLSYIATVNASESTGFTCMHGQNECTGDIQQLCVNDLAPPSDTSLPALDFAVCQDQSQSLIPSNAEKCAGQVGVSYADVSACTSGDRGRALMTASVNNTQSAGVRASCTIFLSGASFCVHDGEWKDCPSCPDGGDYGQCLTTAICAAYTGKDKPAACGSGERCRGTVPEQRVWDDTKWCAVGSPSSFASAPFAGATGIADDSCSHWFFAKGTSVYRTNYTLDIDTANVDAVPADLQAAGFSSIGEIDFFGAKIVMPVANSDASKGSAIVELSASTLEPVGTPALVADVDLTWVAVDYGSLTLYAGSPSAPSTLFAFDVRNGYARLPNVDFSTPLAAGAVVGATLLTPGVLYAADGEGGIYSLDIAARTSTLVLDATSASRGAPLQTAGLANMWDVGDDGVLHVAGKEAIYNFGFC